MIVTLKLLASNRRPTTRPKRPNPAIIIGFSDSSTSSYSSLFCHRDRIGLTTLSLKTSRRGEMAMESATTSKSNPAVSGSKSRVCFEKEIKTNANSLDWASRNANRNSYPFFSRKNRPSRSNTKNFKKISRKTYPRIRKGSSMNNRKLMLAPTEIKNSPRSNPLKGSMVVSNSCRYSLSASTTPARKVPSAGERPIADMARAIPMTSNRAMAVNISCKLVSAINLKT